MYSRTAHTAALLAGAAGLVACQDRPYPAEPTAFATPTVSAASATSTVASVTLTRWQSAALTVADARARLVPSLGTTAPSGAVGGSLTGLATAIDAADASALPSLIDAAGQALDRYLATADPSQRANGDAVRLTLDAVARLTANDGGTRQR